jgi:hypothetical protein
MWTAFTVEVHVRAELLAEPKDCLKENIQPCAILNLGQTEVITLNSSEMRLLDRTAIKIINTKKIEILTGQMLFSTESEAEVRSLYGNLKIKNGRVLMSANNHEIQFTALKGNLTYLPRGSHKSGKLQTGFTDSMARVSTDGVSPSGYARPAVLLPLLKAWAQFFYKPERSIYESQVLEFKTPWQWAVKMTGDWHLETAKRQLASLEAERLKKAKEAYEREAENRMLRDMFKRRNFLD